ncbi:Fe-S cluster assembly protein IscX [Marinobacterium stanieri]|uniref:FeS assembly protein IscX n=1 Tax=Marinobacterium stanieri TaxID=49186 RepID=A0A1N6TSX1_9GAMM|nr:Fe-S cluster assembly protein IscX [Marinobacterium stanieri]SIQ56414.1 FeS assembly protein IscX [Marinobacterium stanieri]
MGLKWVDVNDIAIELADTYPEQDPLKISFPDLYTKVMELEEFDDDPDHCGEKILEAIQMAWIDEAD